MFQTGKLPDLLIVSHYTEEYFIWISVGPSFIVSMETGHCIRYTMHDSFCFQNCLNSSRHRFNMETFIRDFRPILTSYWHHDIAAYLSAAHPQCSFLFQRILKVQDCDLMKVEAIWVKSLSCPPTQQCEPLFKAGWIPAFHCNSRSCQSVHMYRVAATSLANICI